MTKMEELKKEGKVDQPQVIDARKQLLPERRKSEPKPGNYSSELSNMLFKKRIFLITKERLDPKVMVLPRINFSRINNERKKQLNLLDKPEKNKGEKNTNFQKFVTKPEKIIRKLKLKTRKKPNYHQQKKNETKIQNLKESNDLLVQLNANLRKEINIYKERFSKFDKTKGDKLIQKKHFCKDCQFKKSKLDCLIEQRNLLANHNAFLTKELSNLQDSKKQEEKILKNSLNLKKLQIKHKKTEKLLELTLKKLKKVTKSKKKTTRELKKYKLDLEILQEENENLNSLLKKRNDREQILGIKPENA